jgi:hypothetical protein
VRWGKVKEGAIGDSNRVLTSSCEVQDVASGKIYKWHPKKDVVECECGERVTLDSVEMACGWCGTEHATLVQEELEDRPLEDEAIHPWRCAEDREEYGLPC